MTSSKDNSVWLYEHGNYGIRLGEGLYDGPALGRTVYHVINRTTGVVEGEGTIEGQAVECMIQAEEWRQRALTQLKHIEETIDAPSPFGSFDNVTTLH